MHEFIQANRDHWNELTDLHIRPDAYDLRSFVEAWRRGEEMAPPGAEELGDLAGKRVLHLQCHFGLDTLCLARMGAKVTGIDLSDRSIEVARSTGKELGVDATFHQSDVLKLDLPESFELVYSSLGVLCWLPDLRPWAQVIARHLEPGGLFYLLENHPVASIFDTEQGGELKVRHPYFRSEEPVVTDGPGSYAAPGAPLRHSVTYEWNHSIADVLTALLSAGLTIESFREFPFCGYRIFPFLVETEHGWRLPDHLENRLPLAFSVKARRAARP